MGKMLGGRLPGLMGAIMLLMTACAGSRMLPSEKAFIRQGEATEPMRVLSVFNKADSLVLRTPARTVSSFKSDDIQLLASRMLASVMDSATRGVGIAAPQVGISRQAVLVQRFDKAEKPFELILNPVIKRTSAFMTGYNEGCLSIPGYRGWVERPDTIWVEYKDIKGRQQKEKVHGFTARIFQHEIDHLHGILYTDRIPAGSLKPDME